MNNYESNKVNNQIEANGYWLKEIERAKKVSKIKYDFYNTGYEKHVYSTEVDVEVAVKIKNLCKNNKFLLYTFLVSGLSIELYKYSLTKDVVVGILGHKINGQDEIIRNKMLPLRVEVNSECTCKEYMSTLRSKILKSYQLQDELNIEELSNNNICRDIMDISPISLSLIGYNNEKSINYVCDSSKNEIALCIDIREDITFNISATYNSGLYARKTIELFVKRYIKIIKQISNSFQEKILSIDLISDEEKSKILYDFNNTGVEYNKNCTIADVFEKQVCRNPTNIAVVFKDSELTYRELNEKANQLAQTLRDKGIKENSLVGIMLERRPEMIIALMAVLKAGGAYVPIDHKYPQSRVDYILEDSNTSLLITNDELKDKFELDTEVLLIEDKSIFSDRKTNLEKINNSESLAYIIYTSGSTGNPKGVLIKQRSVINLVQWFGKSYNIKKNENILQNTSLSFDVSVEEIFGALLNDGTVQMTTEYDLIDKEKFREFVNKNNVNLIQLVPSTLQQLIIDNEKMDSIEVLICGGEPLPISMKKQVVNMGYNLYNCYGPTETTVDAITSKCVKDGPVVIGKPMDNTKAYILNGDRQLLPIGVFGELCISGEGLAIGYLNKPELTSEKFVENPIIPNTKMYRTGDIARWLPDGNIEFLERIDNQVKIRGLRIELGEIENSLLQYEGIKEAVVIVLNNQHEEKYLCGYIVTDGKIDSIKLRDYLKQVLPDYMVPSYFITLDNIPLTINGKVDKKALPEPNIEELIGTEYEAPKSEVEKKLVEIWTDVLKVNKIGINDNFFDLGGHSLKGTLIINKIHKELNVEVPLKKMFESPTIKEMSQYIENTTEKQYIRIEKAEKKEYYEISSAQKRLYMIQQLNTESTAYNMPTVYELEGEINIGKIEESFKKLIKRHEVLRTEFQMVDNKIVQKINDEIEFNVVVKEYNQESIEDISKSFIRTFDFKKAPLFRVEVTKILGRTYLLIDMHHIISDGISVGILIRDFKSFYNQQSIESLRIQYKDFTQWQNKFFESEELKKQEKYWINKFNDEIPVLKLPYDYKRPKNQSFKGDSLSFIIDKDITEELRRIAKETQSTMNMVLLSTFNILLSKYSGQEDIIVGVPIAGRKHTDLQSIMGMFVNTLAIRSMPNDEKIFSQFLKEVKESLLEAYENQDYQFDTLIENLNLVRDTSRNPLFDVIFSMNNEGVEEVSSEDLNGLTVKHINIDSKVSKADLSLAVNENEENIQCVLVYCSELFKKETARRIIEHYKELLRFICSNEGVKVSEIEIMGKEEKYELIKMFNDTYSEYPRDKTIHQLFEEQVEKNPDNIALIYDGEKISYKELNAKANNLARVLLDEGVKQEDIVGIMVERSFEMIIGILGVLKAGGAYLPIDPEYPQERIKYMLEDSRSNLLLTKSSLESKGNKINLGEDISLIYLDQDNIFDGETNNLSIVNSSSNLAYVIYTSGSTGKPKGVMIEHRTVVNFMEGMVNRIDFEKLNTILSLTTMSFDIFIFETLLPLVKGLEVVIAGDTETRDSKAISELILENKVDLLQATPSRMKLILNDKESSESLKELKVIAIGGEPFPKDVLEGLKNISKTMKIYNMYGPTETTIWSSIKDLTKTNDINIGTPIANTEILILDKYGKIQPIGVNGELCIGGECLARGYLNRLDLTDERFVSNPYKTDGKIYRTGDLARWLPDGNIEFIGRVDHQVKIRGYRIELGEIENQLLKHEDIKQVTVVAREDSNKVKYLCGYIVGDRDMNSTEIKEYLEKELPRYMIPSYIIQLDEMPLTANGKVNKKLLPETKGKLNTGVEYEMPRNEIEERLVEIWSEVLGVEKVGIKDNFFDLGGYSLKGIQVINLIEKRLNKTISLQDFLSASTIDKMSNIIYNSDTRIYEKINKLPEKEHYETSYGQKRLWIINQIDSNSTKFNMEGEINFSEKVDKDIIVKTLEELFNRHEAFRTKFKEINGNLVQIIDQNIRIPLEFWDLDGLAKERKAEKRDEIKLNIKNTIFNLETSPLIRIALIKLNKEEFDLIFCIHHIIFDGYSSEILKKEFQIIYNGNKEKREYELEEMPIQYKEFAAWQNELIKDENKMKEAKEFWHDQLSEEIEPLKLPVNYSNYDSIDRKTSTYRIALNNDIKEGIHRLAKEYNASTFTVLTSALNVLLWSITNQKDIMVGTAAFGRENADLKNVIGYFVNTTIIRTRMEEFATFKEFILSTNDTITKSLQYQKYPLELLLDELKISYPKIDVFLNLLNLSEEKEKLVDFDAYQVEDAQETKFDITIYAMEYTNGIELSCVYLSELFNQSFIEYIIKKYVDILKSGIKNPNESLKSIVKPKKSKRKF